MTIAEVKVDGRNGFVGHAPGDREAKIEDFIFVHGSDEEADVSLLYRGSDLKTTAVPGVSVRPGGVGYFKISAPSHDEPITVQIVHYPKTQIISIE